MFILNREEAIMAALRGKKVKRQEEGDDCWFSFSSERCCFYYGVSGHAKSLFKDVPYILVEEQVPFHTAARASREENKVMVSVVSGHSFCLYNRENSARISLTLEEIMGPWLIRDSVLL